MIGTSKQRKALKAVLRLLAWLREMLKVEGAEGTDLFKTVDAHAQLVGAALPNKDRLSKEEMQKIADALRRPVAKPMPALPKSGEFVVLTPEQMGQKKLITPK